MSRFTLVACLSLLLLPTPAPGQQELPGLSCTAYNALAELDNGELVQTIYTRGISRGIDLIWLQTSGESFIRANRTRQALRLDYKELRLRLSAICSRKAFADSSVVSVLQKIVEERSSVREGPRRK